MAKKKDTPEIIENHVECYLFDPNIKDHLKDINSSDANDVASGVNCLVDCLTSDAYIPNAKDALDWGIENGEQISRYKLTLSVKIESLPKIQMINNPSFVEVKNNG